MIQFVRSFYLYLVFFILTGLGYPLMSMLAAWLFYPQSYHGQWLTDNSGAVRGSFLVGQAFTRDQYFWPRPSVTGYQPLPGQASNFAPSDPVWLHVVEQRKKQDLQAEMLFASASGLDPHISFESALLQLDRVANARKIDRENLRIVLQSHLEKPFGGFYGRLRVNVLRLNAAIDEQFSATQ